MLTGVLEILNRAKDSNSCFAGPVMGEAIFYHSLSPEGQNPDMYLQVVSF